MNTINYLINILRDKETSLREYTTNQDYGLNVNNFVSTYKYDVIVLQEQITLYEKYLDFFYHVHEKLLQRLITKVSVLEAQLNADIKFEGGLIGKKKDNKVLFDELGINGLNKKTARELRKSITGHESPLSIGYETEFDEVNVADENNYFTTMELDQSDESTNSISSFDCIPPPSTPTENVTNNVTNNVTQTMESVAIKIFNAVEEPINDNFVEETNDCNSIEYSNEEQYEQIVEEVVEEVVEDMIDALDDEIDDSSEQTNDATTKLTAKQKKNMKKNIRKKQRKLHEQMEPSQSEDAVNELVE